MKEAAGKGPKRKILLRERSIIIAVAILLSLALVFGTMISNFKSTYENARNDVIELSKSSSLQNAESIEMFFTRHEDVLLAASEIIDYTLTKDASNEEEVQTLLRNLSKQYNEAVYKRFAEKDFTGIYAAVNGRIIHSNKTEADLPAGYDPALRQWYKEGIAGNGKVVFGDPYYDVYDPSIQVMTATKMLSDGKTVVGMDVTLEDLQYLGGGLSFSVTLNGQKHDYGHGFILTNNGIVMAHWLPEEQGQDYSDANHPMHSTFRKIKECLAQDKDYIELDMDGTNYGIFPQQLRNGWYVVTLTDLQDIRTAISDFVTLLFIGMAFILIVGTAYGFFVLKAYIKAETLAESLQDALNLAKSDTLTSLKNRTAYDLRVSELKDNIDYEDEPFALVMMDLNDLKYINDHHGHKTGDQYIINCCNIVRSVFSCDIYRIGGDEFAVFLSGADYENREQLLEAMKNAVAEANMKLVPNVDNPSIAVGMAIHTLGRHDIDAVQRKADAAMYTNKLAIKQARLTNSETATAESIKLSKQAL